MKLWYKRILMVVICYNVFGPSEFAADEMGYAMSRLEIESDLCDAGKDFCGVGSSSGSQRSSEHLAELDHEISQISQISISCIHNQIIFFQGSHIRIYNVEKGWKVQKDIHAKSLRWTVTEIHPFLISNFVKIPSRFVELSSLAHQREQVICRYWK